MFRTVTVPFLGCIVAAVMASELPAAPDTKVAEQGLTFLRTYCTECHGPAGRSPKVLDRKKLLAPRRRPYVVPGQPELSLLWQVVESGRMPPEDAGKQPGAADKQAFRTWITAGAPFPTPATDNRQAAASAKPTQAQAAAHATATADGRPAARPAADRAAGWRRPTAAPTGRRFKSTRDVLEAIYRHLTATPSADRPFQRYFTLTNLYNNVQVTDDDLRLYRAALSKLVNSLSWEEEIVLPRPIDDAGTVYNIDLRRLNWQKRPGLPDVWQEVLKVYPYGLRFDEDLDETTRETAKLVYQLARCNIPAVRADWFVATASRPPLYHTILRLPANLKDLEKRLQVDVAQNFLDNNLVRAGLTTSGISEHNRVVERHAAAYGAYWRTYDFRSSDDRANILRFPLGPKFKGNPFDDAAFVHAGGEVIFNLPNRLQGYLLVNARDERIDRAPVEIVQDRHRAGGTPEVINGLSCIQCHQRGMIDGFRDLVRNGSGVFGRDRVKVQELYPVQDVLNDLLHKDERRFTRALDEATAGFLGRGGDRGGPVALREPVGALAGLYSHDVDLATAAADLGVPDPAELRATIRRNGRLQELGLGPLAAGETVKRELWERARGISLLQQAAREMDLGIPVRVR